MNNSNIRVRADAVPNYYSWLTSLKGMARRGEPMTGQVGYLSRNAVVNGNP